MKILLTLLFFSLFFVSENCEIIDSELTSSRSMSVESITISNFANTSIYLIPVGQSSIAGSDVINNFMNGWKYEKDIVSNGYTATDDLWTLIGYSNESSSMEFDHVRLDLITFEQGSEQWDDFMNELESRVNKFPMIINIKVD